MFSNTSSGNLFGGNNNNTNINAPDDDSTIPREIVPRPHHRHQQQQESSSSASTTTGVTQISGARPNQKRQPHGGAKSHKLLDKASFQNLFVARLPRGLVSNDALLKVFAHYLPVSATIMMNVETGQSKGFGFVTFETEAEGQQAFENLNNRKLRIEVESSSPSTATTNNKEIIFFTPEIKPSTFNGHRIVVESPHVYVRNIPVALFSSSSSSSINADPFESLLAFFSNFGEVQHIEFHGGQTSLEDVMSQQQSGGETVGGEQANETGGNAPATTTAVAPPVLVSFATKEQASAALAACHGKVVFPELSSTALMAKYADMTTVKSISRQHHQTIRRRSSPQELSSSSVSTVPSLSPSSGFPFPTTRAQPVSVSGNSSHSCILPLHRNSSSESSLPSPASSTRRSSGAPLQQLRRPSPPTEFWTPMLSLPSGGEQLGTGVAAGRVVPPPQPGVVHHQEQSLLGGRRSSSSSSAATGSRRDSYYSLAASSSHHSHQSQHHHNQTPHAVAPTPLYRNDPYNQSGYVMVTSSSSSSSSASSSFVLGQ